MSSEVALLDKAASKQELQDALKSNVEDANRMELLINNLLRLTKLDSDELAANFIDVQSEMLVSEAVDRVQTIATDKKITLRNESNDARIHGDPDSLIQLLVILLENAIKYSPEKSTVTVDSSIENDKLLLHIKDEGPGISPEALPHVFDRFYREDKARTTDGESFGLGLSIAKMIADRNGANITLTSKPKKGTTALVALPLAAKESTKSAGVSAKP
jgi:signal transduction histidine kinase